MKTRNKVTVLNAWVHTNLKWTCLNVSPMVKDLPESKIVTAAQNLIISRMLTWATDDSWWVSRSVVAITFVCISQLLGDSCHNLTYRNMHLLRYHYTGCICSCTEIFHWKLQEGEQIIIGPSWKGPEKLLRCPSRIPMTSLYCVSINVID